MKKLLIVIALLCATFSQAQMIVIKDADVPAAVKQALKKKHPAAKVSEWRKDSSVYKAHILTNKNETVVDFDNKGSYLKTETKTKVAEFPKQMSDFLVANFRGKKISEGYKVTDSMGKTLFRAEIDHADYFFDLNGNFVRQEMH